MIHVMTQTDHEESGRVVIYPNPASTYITLQLPDQKSLYEINILDTTGKVVRKRLCNGDKQSIPVNDLANGAYLVEIITKQDRMAAPILIMH